MIFDIVVLLVLLISALHAFWRGFIREVLTILGAIGGVFAAITFAGQLRPVTNGWLSVKEGEKVTKLFDIIPMDLVSSALSYGLIFILVFGILTFISHLIAEQVRALGLGAVDRTLGVVFGLARGVLVLMIFYLPVYIVIDQKNKDDWFKESKTYVYVDTGTKWMIAQLPEDMRPTTKTPETMPDDKPDSSTLDDLRTTSGKKKPEEPTSAGTNTPKVNESGYNELQRQVLDKLIDKGSAIIEEPSSPAPMAAP
jgi:membrane protein required for colicin V production